MPHRQDLVLAGGRVLRGNPPTLEALDVLICDGIVTELGTPDAELLDGARRLDVSGRVITPGLINGHSHSYGQVCRHLTVDARLEAWLPVAMWTASGLDPAALRTAAQLNAIDNLRHGVTTTLDHAALAPTAFSSVVHGYCEVGARTVLALQVGDLGPEGWLAPRHGADRAEAAELSALPVERRPEVLVERTEQLLELVQDLPLISAQVGPSAPERCSDALLGALGDLVQQRGAGVHTHWAETRLQAEYDGLDRLAGHGLLGPRTTVAHAVHVTSSDRVRLAESGASVIHDPLCNLLLGSGIANLPELLEAGITVGMGTDGWATGGTQDLLAEARVALGIGRVGRAAADWLAPQDVFHMLGPAGAETVGLGGQLGQIELGRRADLLIVDPVRANWLMSAELVPQIIFAGLGGGLESVIVDGREVWRDGHPCLVDDQALVQEAEAQLRSVMAHTQAAQPAVAALAAVMRRHDLSAKEAPA